MKYTIERLYQETLEQNLASVVIEGIDKIHILKKWKKFRTMGDIVWYIVPAVDSVTVRQGGGKK